VNSTRPISVHAELRGPLPVKIVYVYPIDQAVDRRPGGLSGMFYQISFAAGNNGSFSENQAIVELI